MKLLVHGALAACAAAAVGTALARDAAPTRLADTTTDDYAFGGSRPRECTRLGDLVLFAAGTRLTGRELWVTDGTEAGTRLVVELVPGAAGSSPRGLFALEGHVYFEAETASRGLAPWRTDGTAAGTVPVATLPLAPDTERLVPGSDDVRHLLFFSEDADGLGFELHRSDGTVGGTYLVKDIYPGPESSFPGQFVRVGDVVFFTARTAEAGIELWKTDGTPEGTVLVKDVRPGPTWGAVRHLAALDDRLLLFSGWDADHGTELWRSDGTAAGTFLVKDLAPRENQSGDPHDIRDVGDGTAYFAAATDLALIELWRTDGTPEGTYLVRDIEPDHPDAHVDDVVRVRDGVLFTASRDPGTAYRVLWASDGTAPGTLRRDASESGGDAPRASIALGEGAIGLVPERDLFVSGGLSGPGGLVGAPFPEPSTNVWGRLVPFGERVLVQIDVGAFPFLAPELWITDGTPEGTLRIGPTGRASEIADDVAHLGDSVYLAFSGTAIQRTDGTPEGTSWIAMGDSAPWETDSLVTAGGRVLFLARNPSTGLRGVAVVSPGADSASVLDTLDVRSFESVAGGPMRSLWGIGSTTLFVRRTADELWKTDGTLSRTAKVADVVPGWGAGPAQSDIAPVRVGSRVLFAALTPEQGLELWCVEDGAAGASLVADIAPGSADSRPNGLLPLGSSGFAVFAAWDGVHGMEPWITDGTPPGTRLLADVRPGPGSSNPRELAQAGPHLFFVADADAAGEEPWSLSLADLGLPDTAFDGSTGFVSDDEPVGAAPDPFDLDRVRVKLDFRRRSKDRVRVAGALAVAADFEPEGAHVVVQIADLTEVFVLDASGRARVGKNRFRLRLPGSAPEPGRFELRIAGALKDGFARDGLTRDAGAAPAMRTVRVGLLLDGVTRGQDVDVVYRVRHRRGKAHAASESE